MYSLQKTATFAIMHMLVAFSVVFAFTGSFALGGAVAVVEPLCNTITYFFHEKVWERRGKRRHNGSGPMATA